MNLKKYFIVILIAIYLTIGLLFWWIGNINGGTFLEQILTFFYIVLLWPFVVGTKIFCEKYIVDVLIPFISFD